MAIRALLYVSRARVRGDAAEAAVADILQVSRARNRALNVTGALLFSGGHFAQFLEGSRESLDELMRSIARDPRHKDLAILQAGAAAVRLFPNWSLAYAGRSTFVDGTLAAALDTDAAAAPGRTREVLSMLEGFTAR